MDGLAVCGCVVQVAGSGADLHGLVDREDCGEMSLELLPVVVLVFLALVQQEFLDHRVVASREFDNEVSTERSQEPEDLRDRDRGRENEMVDECKAERQIGFATGQQAATLLSPPAETRRRLSQVHDKGQDLLLVLVA